MFYSIFFRILYRVLVVTAVTPSFYMELQASSLLQLTFLVVTGCNKLCGIVVAFNRFNQILPLLVKVGQLPINIVRGALSVLWEQ